MDENEYYEQNEELQNQNSKRNSFSSDLIDNAASSIVSKENKERTEADKESINKRGKNEQNHSNRFGGLKNKREEEEESSDKKTLPKKDGLEDKNKLTDNKDNKKKDRPNVLGSLKEKAEEDKKIKALKLKIYLYGMAIVLGLLVLFMIVVILIYAVNTMYGSIASFFGVSEVDTQEGLSEQKADGLLTNEEYLINPETGEMFTREELVAYLKSDGACKTTTIARILDWFDGLDGSFGSYCGYYRYMSKYLSELEEKYNTQLDRGMIVTTIFYGFSNQEDYYDYYSPSTVNKDITNAYNQYESLQSIVEEKGVLTKDNLKAVMDNTLLDESHDYYTWEVVPIYDDDNEIVGGKGVCKKGRSEYAHYSSFKWQIMMRFGEEASKKYEEDLQYGHSFESSDDECKMGMSDAELLERVRAAGYGDRAELDRSVRKANDVYKERRYVPDLSPFSQKANVETNSRDVFVPYEDMQLDYANGFANKNFPAFEKSFNNPSIDLQYDYVITPKQIEDYVNYVMERKKDVNYYLDFPDLDDNEYTQIGDYVIGANCEGYLSAAPDSITVNVTDCDGKAITKTSFKDYIMGVAYGEVSNSGDNYVLSEMVAAISYSLNRRNNYMKGTEITMKSGNCDQVYCPMSAGCYPKESSISCGSKNCTSYYPGGGSYHGVASSALQEKYSNYYETAKNYLVVSNDKPHSAHYVSSIQLGWKAKAEKGIPFTQIIQEEYEDEGAQLIQCNGASNDGSIDTDFGGATSSSVGSSPTSAYPEVAPNKGKFYGFSYNDAPEGRNITINPEWIKANIVSINTNCTSGGWVQSFQVNKAAVPNFTEAYRNMCKLLTTGVTLSDGSHCKYTASQYQNGGTFVQRKTSSGGYSLHAYGLAQDWNYTSTITYNGQTFKPYANQGASTKAEYDRFVRALGKEERCENINYILWKYAFQNAGFNWGGNWSVSYWDGMHFEVKY